MLEIFQEIYNQTPLEFWISVLFFVWAIICLWRIFLKAWRKWWEALIPARHIYVLFKISKRVNPWFWILLSLPVISYWLAFLLAISIFTLNWGLSEILYWIINFVGILAVAIYTIMLYGLTLAFWKTKWFMLWLFFFWPIFFWILAFDKSTYIWNK